MKKKFLMTLAIGIFMFGLSISASATVVSYNNYSAFTAAVTGATDYNFEGIATVFDPNDPDNTGLAFVSPTIAGVTFTDNNIPFVIDKGSNSNYGVSFFAGQGNLTNDPANKVTVSLTGFNAIGFYYGSYLCQNEPYLASLNTGDNFNLSLPANPLDVNFIGFVSDAGPITNIDFTSVAGTNLINAAGHPLTPNGFDFDIIKFTLANAAPVPEPATMILLGFGLLGVAGVSRKKK